MPLGFGHLMQLDNIGVRYASEDRNFSIYLGEAGRIVADAVATNELDGDL